MTAPRTLIRKAMDWLSAVAAVGRVVFAHFDIARMAHDDCPVLVLGRYHVALPFQDCVAFAVVVTGIDDRVGTRRWSTTAAPRLRFVAHWFTHIFSAGHARCRAAVAQLGRYTASRRASSGIVLFS